MIALTLLRIHIQNTISNANRSRSWTKVSLVLLNCRYFFVSKECLLVCYVQYLCPHNLNEVALHSAILNYFYRVKTD